MITWLDTVADEAWAQGQISRYPGWYSQLMYITHPIPGFSTSTFEHDCDAMLSKAKRPVEIDDESLNKRPKSGKGSSFV